MKKISPFFAPFLYILPVLTLFLFSGCEDPEIKVQTVEVKDVNQISAKCIGQVSDNEKIIEKGILLE